MDLGVDFQQEFSFPLGHAGFCLIQTKKGMLKSYSAAKGTSQLV